MPCPPARDLLRRALPGAAAAIALLACVPKHAALPERADAELAKGDRAYARGDLAAAEARYGRAIEEASGPEALEARYLRARVRVERGDLAAAEADVLALLEAEPRHWEGLSLLGLIRERQGRRSEAVEAFRRAAEIAPDELAPRNNLAFLALQDGRDQEAYDLLVDITRDHPHSARAWTNLALAADRLGRGEEAAAAREAARRAAEADAQEPEGAR